MKKLNKIIFFMILCLCMMPITGLKVFAYSGGLIDGLAVSGSTAEIFNEDMTTKVTDDNLSTYYVLTSHNTGKDHLNYKFPSPVSITGFKFNSNILPSSGYLEVNIRNASGTSLFTMNITNNDGSYVALPNPVSNASQIMFFNGTSTSVNVYELDVFNHDPGVDSMPPSDVSNLSAVEGDGQITLNWSNPSDNDFDGVKIYQDGVLISDLTDGNSATIPTPSKTITGLKDGQTYTFKVSTVDVIGNESASKTIVATPHDTTPPGEVKNLTGTPTYNSISLSWTNPPDTDFAKVKIYENGTYQKSVTASENSTAIFNDLDTDTLYTFKVTTIDLTGNESIGSSISVKTLPPPELKEIKNLNAAAKFDRVKLTWDLPESQYFHHVTIYRKTNEKTSFLQSIFSLGTITAYAEGTTDEYKPMFETNGTYWTDLTVTPETDYQYKLTSVNTLGEESKGITIDTSTPQEPEPEIKGATFQTSPTGDYVVTWQQPTTGTMKILVGGSEYKTVSADQGSYTIPKSDLQYTKIGDPDVALIPVSKFGTEGNKVIAPSENIKIPFTAKDLVDSGNGILLLLAPFILLALSFLLVPKFRKIIVSAFQGKDRTDPERPNGRKSKDKEPSRNEQREKNIRADKERKEPKQPKIREEREQRTERILRQPRERRESRFQLKRQPRTIRTERETRQPREPRERKRG